MICERFIFIIIYLALSGCKSASAWAAEPLVSKLNLHNNAALVNKYRVSATKKSNFKPYFEYQKIAEQAQLSERQSVSQLSKTGGKLQKISKANSAIAQESSVSPEPPSKISRRWSLGGIVLTSAIAMFLIWILFRKPAQMAEVDREKVSKDQKLQRNDKQSKVRNKLKSEPASSKTPVAQSDLLENSINPAKTVNDSLNTEDLAAENDVIKADADSDPTDFDVVHELIKDLQGLDNSSDTVSLRRKAIWKLTKVGDYRTIEPLLKIMPLVGELDKSLILEAVTQISNRSFQPLNDKLFADLQHQNPEVRLNAVRDLKGLYQFVSPVITKIAKMQSDPDYEVRQTATQTLQQLNANPLPTFTSYGEDRVDDLVVGEESEANLHLVAYLLAELDAEG